MDRIFRINLYVMYILFILLIHVNFIVGG
jgi:hypothetical protein